MVDVGIEMPGTGARSPKRGSWDHQRGARKLDLAGFCYRFATKNDDALVIMLRGKAVTLGYTTDFATTAYGEQIELTLPAKRSPSRKIPTVAVQAFRCRDVIIWQLATRLKTALV